MTRHTCIGLISLVIIVALSACSGPRQANVNVPLTTAPQPEERELHPATQQADTPDAPAPESLETSNLDVDLPYVQGGGALPTGATARIGIGDVFFAAPLPDGPQFVLGTTTGLYAYRLPDFEPVWRRYFPRRPFGLSLSPDMTRIRTSNSFKAGPLLYDAISGNRIADINDGWYLAAWSPAGDLLAVEEKPPLSGELMGRIRLYDSRSGDLVRVLETPIDFFYGAVFQGIRWSPNGSYIAGCREDMLYIWDVGTARLVHTYEAGLYYCEVAFSHDSVLVAFRAMDGEVYIADLATGALVFNSDDHADEHVLGFEWLPGAIVLVESNHITVFDPDTWSEIWHVDADFADLRPYPWPDMRLSPTRERLAIASSNGIVALREGLINPEYEVDVPTHWVEWSPGETWLMSIYEREYLITDYTILNAKNGAQVFGPVQLTYAEFIDEQYAIAADGCRAMLVDLNTGKVINGAQVCIPVEQMAWSQDGDTLILSASDGDWYWSAEADVLTRTPPDGLQVGPSLDLAESAQPSLTGIPLIETESLDGTFRIAVSNERGCGDGPYGPGCGMWGATFDILRGEEIMFSGEFSGAGIRAATWSADGSMLALGLGSGYVALEDHRIVVVDPNTGEELLSLEGHLDDVRGLLFSSDGRRLASVSDDSTVIVWQVNPNNAPGT